MLARHLYFAASSSVLAIAATLAGSVHAQQPASPSPAPESTQEPASVKPSGPAPFVLSSSEQGHDAPAVSEAELRQQLQGKTFYLRSGYLDNTLHFDEAGRLDGNSPKASYTLSLAEITRVRLEKHRLQLEAVRYGLHFLGASPTEDQTAAVDKVRLTTAKKPLIITIDREQVAKPKKEKEKHEKHRGPQTPADSPSAAAAATQPAAGAEAESDRHHAITDSEANANRTLAQALDVVFASGIDDRMIATLPDYWRLYYQSVAERHAYKPADPAVLRPGDVDQKARLVSVIDPPSNEFAQKNGVAGMALYHVVIGADGRPREIAVGRPIGFGLDENAVKSIQQAKFEPATKAGQPVPVTLDLLVRFRIYSKRTGQASNQPAAGTAQPAAPMLPGPYTANAPRPQPEPVAAQQPAPADTAPQTAPSQPAAPSDAAQQPQEQTAPAPQPR
jgi:TonB family protein